MIEVKFKAYHQIITFMLPLSNCCYHHFTGDIACFAYMDSTYHTFGFIIIFYTYFMHTITIFNDDYVSWGLCTCMQFCKQRKRVKLNNITFFLKSIY